MTRDFFWLTDDQFAWLKPLLPTDTRGKPRVDDRRVVSGIVHVLKSGGRWIDAPAVYGPRKTCLIPGFDGALFSSEWKDALWARFCTGAPLRSHVDLQALRICPSRAPMA